MVPPHMVYHSAGVKVLSESLAVTPFSSMADIARLTPDGDNTHRSLCASFRILGPKGFIHQSAAYPPEWFVLQLMVNGDILV